MPHTLSYLANCSMLFTEVPLLERPAAAKAAGFDAVEFWWPFTTATPDDGEVDRFVGAVSDAGTTLVGLNFAAGDMPAGDRGLVSWPGREPEFRDSVDIAVCIAERLGTRAFNALYGNRAEGLPPRSRTRSRSPTSRSPRLRRDASAQRCCWSPSVEPPATPCCGPLTSCRSSTGYARRRVPTTSGCSRTFITSASTETT